MPNLSRSVTNKRARIRKTIREFASAWRSEIIRNVSGAVVQVKSGKLLRSILKSDSVTVDVSNPSEFWIVAKSDATSPSKGWGEFSYPAYLEFKKGEETAFMRPALFSALYAKRKYMNLMGKSFTQDIGDEILDRLVKEGVAYWGIASNATIDWQIGMVSRGSKPYGSGVGVTQTITQNIWP